MKPTMEILTKLQENSKKHHDEVFTRLFRYMLRSDLYFIAYQHLYSNAGAGTKGMDDDTADGFSEKSVETIIEALRTETYRPKPVRRTYIEKSHSKKMRPLGLPTFTDKLVQEVMRMILESVYEPVFSYYSHGFRPGRSCHTALAQIKHEFIGACWFVEGDIKGCFDNIDHQRDSQNVYFLNVVTETDLMALAEQNSPTESVIPEPISEPEPKPEEVPEPEPVPEPEKSSNGTLIFILIAALAVGGTGYYFKIYRPKQESGSDDFDNDDDYEDEYDFNEDVDEDYIFEDDAFFDDIEE